MIILLSNTPILAVVFLLGSSFVSGAASALQRLGKHQAQELLQEAEPGFFFKSIRKLFFLENKREPLSFSLNLSKQILQICYAFAAFFYLSPELCPTSAWVCLLGTMALIIAISLLTDFITYWCSLIRPKIFFKIAASVSTPFLLVLRPLSFLCFQGVKILFPSIGKKEAKPSFRIRDRILEVLHDSELAPYLDPNDQKLILSVVSFKERIAREVMVPRIDVFGLSSEATLEEASKSFLKEGYSRIPVYRESVDNIIGFLLYKDVLKSYAQTLQEKPHSAHHSIEKLIKPVFYTPETKKISQLLQEFRSKQIHMAIVVDEYGGTEGIVTIEDILEELVGEISDEYDIGEEAMYTVLPGGGWVVDARMSIIDIEEELGIKIPHSAEYDTIGGYIFHRAGTIPSKGWQLHHDDFDLEVLSSDERSIDKVHITPHLHTE